MAAPLQLGVLYSWPQIEVLIAGVPFVGVKSIMFGKTREYKDVHGVGSEPIGRVVGAVKYKTATIDILLDDWKRIILASPNGDPTLLARFQVRLPFVPDPNNPNLPTTDVMQNCQFLTDGNTYKEGDTGFWQSVDIIYAGQMR